MLHPLRYSLLHCKQLPINYYHDFFSLQKQLLAPVTFNFHKVMDQELKGSIIIIKNSILYKKKLKSKFKNSFDYKNQIPIKKNSLRVLYSVNTKSNCLATHSIFTLQ